MKAVFLDFATVGADELDLAPLYAALPTLELFESTAADQVVERIAASEVVLLNKVRLDRRTLQAAPELGFIGLTATGVDNVDLECARERGIAVCNVRGYCTQSVVEHVFGVLLNLTHNLARFQELVRAGAWSRSDEFCLLNYPIRELSAMTLGIVGHGELGSAVAQCAKYFGMRVLIAERPGATQQETGRVPLGELLSRVDVLSLHCPLTPATRNLIGQQELKRMKDSALLINTARGGLVDSTALVAALNEGKLAGAAIDVLPEEPPVQGDPLLECDHPNLIVTPHIAWGTVEARQAALSQLAEAVTAFQQGERMNRLD
ncbi:MAG: D-2-hydroxyacid dehydrogenase [Woeseia sp.]|nr:D-2-hydroxyacid dehydrogenase [Woeseia sp.]MBT8097021.1 D-2-hydroxyacid dehydrogenase [Woeseia sp.]NNE60682.1 D-2-hydroxyacid dehydrogenase [Woeseia sp.]NNL54735.1 D-2-hydroxyacid dehydrogenase [Woeseia sp.]